MSPEIYPLTLTRDYKSLLCGGLSLGEIETEINNEINIQYPWDLIVENERIIGANLDFIIKNQKLKEIRDNVFVGENVEIAKEVAFISNTKKKIVISDGAVIEPFALIEGPVFIGKNSRIMASAQIRNAVTIGESCKVGGEVSSSVISNYSNKAHFGFIGHSYIGEWVNLGAGTTNSNLKNTYGTVRVDYRGVRMETGLTFLGCVIGDFCKTAINTAIYTGKIIGVNSHLFGAVKGNVPSFVNYDSGKMSEFDLVVAGKVQERMFLRRGIKQTEKDLKVLKSVFESTKEDR